ncbi:MAG: PAS domain-containing protein [Burkholderiaceae bacterium]
MNAPSLPPDAPPPALLTAWLAQSHDLLAMTAPDGLIVWANTALLHATGAVAQSTVLIDLLQPGPGIETARNTVLQALQTGALPADTALCLTGPAGAALWVQARATRIDAHILWTLQDTTASRALATQAQRQSERLELAQDFGRLGVWEREIPSGVGRWDRHVFGFWGMAPTEGTPNYADAMSRVHPEDQSASIFEKSTLQAGRYAQHFRVVHGDGSTRWIHSQWEVKNSPGGRPERAVGIMVDDTAIYRLAQSLDSTTAQLKLAAELADIVIWRHDLRTNRVHYNDHGLKVLGIPHRAEGVTLDEARMHAHPDDLAMLAASSAAALTSSVPVDVEARHRRPDGTWRRMLVRRVVERNAAGEPVAFLGVTLDVTDQVERSHRAEQLAQRLEAAARAARVGIWTTSIGMIQTEWNAQMYELFDMVGATRPPTLAEWIAGCVHPDDATRVGIATRDYLRNAQGAVEVEFRTRRRDGSSRWMVLRADIDRSSPEVPRVFGIAMDVTDRHETLAALHQASERSALITRSAGIGTWEADLDNQHARWDEQMFRLRGLEPRALALSREERLALLHPDDVAGVIDSYANPDTTAQPGAYEFRVRLPDGSYRWIASRSAVVFDADGRAVRRVGVNWDVTESRNAEAARQKTLLAERESQAKSQFLSRMSHELRTPLNAVLGFTQLLQSDTELSRSHSQQVKLGHIRSAGEHLLALINDVLDLSSLEAGTLRLDLQAVDLGAAVAQALPLVAALAARHEVALHAGAVSGTVRADPIRLRQVLINLLANAIKYNRPHGQVVIESESGERSVCLRVRDTGRGLNPEQLSHLFEPFNRLGLDSQGIEGSGIGLTVVKALVEGMGGQVHASSLVGHGTVFELTLPASAGAPAPEPLHADPAPAARRPQRSGTLLYIEDNSVNVLLVEELVKTLPGLRTVSEGTGAAGVARALSLRPDVILIDLQLPDFDGFEVLRQLRARPETAATPCIALSANAMPEDIARGLASGFDDYWTKPIKFKPFLDALERLFPGVAPAITAPAAPGPAA